MTAGALAPPLSLSIWAFLCVGFIFSCLLVTGWLQELQPCHLHAAPFKGRKGAIAPHVSF